MSLISLTEAATDFEVSKDELDLKEQGRLDFIEKFPLQSLKDLSVDEYVQGTDENSFSYWLEFKKILFGIGGGNASKFGLYKAQDGNYYSNYGKNKKQLVGEELQSYFNKVKYGIIEALEYVEKGEVSRIKDLNIPIWNMVLQKILSLYYPEKFITIGSPKVLIECAKDIQLDEISLTVKNSIEINFECKRKLSALDVFANWHYDKLGQFIWQTYLDESNRSYYIIGSKMAATITVTFSQKC